MTTKLIGADTLIPDLLGAAPHVRPVLDRYGLRGCGGPLGPMETLAFFASAHDVPLPRLLEELRAACEQPSTSAAPAARPEDAIYRPFFKAGITIVLTLGAVWGAYLLLRIAWAGDFAEANLHEVNAHGHAQIFGWVGLFVMGFAYQAFPRFKHTDLAYPRGAFASGGLMLIGIILRSIGEPAVASLPWLKTIVIGAAWVEVVAIAMFVFVILSTWRNSGKPWFFYDGYIGAALTWFLLQAIYDAIYLAATLSVADRTQLLTLIATWQGPLREIQIHGFALLMILGVSQRMFHYFYGLPLPNARLSLVVLALLNLAILGETTGLVLMRTRGHAWAALWYGASWLLAGSISALVLNWRIFSVPKETDRSLKFLRAAYVWLFVSLAMLLLLPVYQFGLLEWWAPETQAAHLGFSHAYYGAIRHAITVGFVSMMIVGVAAKVVPTLNGVDVRALPALWLPFVLINVGCSLRVGGQVLTDFWQPAFPIAGVSGCLEVAGLAIWGVHLWRIMAGYAGGSRPVDAITYHANEQILATHVVGEVLEHHPQLLAAFLAFGFKPLASVWLRKTLASHVTIGQACRLAGVNEEALLARLNEERPKSPDQKISLPVLS
jgi:NnrS protein/Domain of unknown function (DUF1858)